MKAGRTPKVSGRKVDRDRATVVRLRTTAIAKPSAPEGLLKTTQTKWEQYWTSDVALAAEKVDLPALERLFRYYDEWERCMRAVRRQRVVKGSMGQMRMNPLADNARQLETSIAKLESELGLTPLARARLGISIGEAARTLDSLNEALNDDDDELEDEEPRLIEKQATSRRT